MVAKTLFRFVCAGTVAALLSFDTPFGWFPAGSRPDSYQMGIDKGAGPVKNNNAATIKSIDGKIKGFATLMQQCDVGKYRGLRIRMFGFVKTENVKGWAGLWLRIDGNDEPLAFDNMSDRPITGTNGWQRYDIVLNVPDAATKMAYGALLNGAGQIWFANITIEPANGMAVTSSAKPPACNCPPSKPSVSEPAAGKANSPQSIMQAEPVNLEFKQ